MIKFGLAALFTFEDKASGPMGKVGTRAEKLKLQLQSIGKGAAQFGQGLGQLAMGFAPATVAMGFMTKQGADFEQAIARVRSVMLDTGNKVTPELEALAQTLGATTVFSATQAANAMENLARAGLNSTQIMGAVEGTLAAAAAEGVDLATAADMVASNLKAFNIPAEEAGRVAGVLALASAKTNTNMVQLQEGLKLAGPAAKLANVSLADTTALLGALANVGVKATMSGTSFRQAINQVLTPTKDASKAMGELGLSQTELRKKIDKGDTIGMFMQIVQSIGKVKSPSKQAELAMRILGVRSASIASALNLSEKDMGAFNETLAALRKETGQTAKEMAAIQLKTLSGQMVLLKSAMESVSIGFSKLFSGETAGVVKMIATRVGQLGMAMRIVSGATLTDPKDVKAMKEIPQTIYDIAGGIKEAFSDIKALFKSVGAEIVWVGKILGLDVGGNGVKSVTKLVTKFVVLGAAIAPVALGVLGLTKIFGGLWNVAAGGFKMVGSTVSMLTRTLGGGVLGKFASGIPLLGRVLPGLGKAVNVAEKATAQPVRVVNFDEMGGLGGLGPKIPGAGGNGPTDTANTLGMFARFRGALNGLALRIPKIGGLLTTGLGGGLKAFGSTATMGALKIGGLVAAAGALGYGLGTLIDKVFDVSGKLASAAQWVFGESSKAKAARIAGNEDVAGTSGARQMAATLAGLAARGTKEVGIEGGRKVALTREFAEGRIATYLRTQNFSQEKINATLESLNGSLKILRSAEAPAAGRKLTAAKDAMISRGGMIPVSAGDVVLDRASLAGAVMSQMRGGLAGSAAGGALGQGDPGRVTPPRASASVIKIEVPVSIDGRQIALAVAEVKLDDLERSGARLKPGQRSALLQRGFGGGV